MNGKVSGKSWGVTLICCILLGVCGLHRVLCRQSRYGHFVAVHGRLLWRGRDY